MAQKFFNHPIEIGAGTDGGLGAVPRLPEDHFQPLAPGYLRSKYVGDVISAVVVVAATGVAAAGLGAAGGPIWVSFLAGAGILALIALTAVLQRLSVRHLGFLVRDHDLTFRRGVISRSTQTIPYNRVQHVGIDRGLVERFFGLSTLRLRSAGGDIGIEGLTVDDAARLKELIVSRAGMDAVR